MRGKERLRERTVIIMLERDGKDISRESEAGKE